MKNFKEAGFAPESRLLASFQEDYGLQAPDGDEDGPDDDEGDEDDEDDDEEADSEEESAEDETD